MLPRINCVSQAQLSGHAYFYTSGCLLNASAAERREGGHQNSMSFALVGVIYNWHPETLSYTIYFRGEKVVLKD